MSDAVTQTSSEFWQPVETSTYQDHVIKHVLGATVLGWVVIEDAMHLLLDVGLLWTIYVTAEMSLMAQSVAIDDLENDDLTREQVLQLTSDAQLLFSEGREAAGLQRFTGAPLECTITGVDVFASDSQRRIMVFGETSDLEIETLPEQSHFSTEAKPHEV
jgi:hypothetical protein